MRRLLENLVKRRNPAFRFDPCLSDAAVIHFFILQCMALLRGTFIVFSGRRPHKMLRGKHVRMDYVNAISWGNMLKLGDYVYMSAPGIEGIKLGNNVSIGAFSRLIVATTFDHIGEGIYIGNNVGIGEFAYLGGAGGLKIGDDCIVGQYFSCHPENHKCEDLLKPIRLQGVTRKGITIGQNCWIGSKVTVLDGVNIGDGCVIAAGAVVTKSFPANSVIGGVPAKILRKRGPLQSFAI